MEKIIVYYEKRFKRYAIYVISLPLVIMTVIEFLNAMGRKLYIPFPCAIEAVESLLTISIYFGVSLVALERGHVNVTLVTRKLPASVQAFLDALAHLLGAVAFGVLTYGAWREAFRAVGILEMRIGVYFFPLWPFKVCFAIGMTFLTLQLVINMIKFVQVGRGNPKYAGMGEAAEQELFL